MQLQKQLVAVSHCILNQNAVVHGLERARGAFPFAIDLLSRGIAIIQLPCPEFLVLGGDRPPMSYEEYAALPDFRQQCQQMLQPIIQQIQAYQAEGYHYLGVIGINESPNCSISGQRGVLMEEFFEKCQKAQLNTDYLEVPTWYSEDSEGVFKEKLHRFLEKC
ncbi:CD3072 family TudS-related putative desulfidase [Enterococcus xiangfangensis]|uniref:CD3072 family TudS-related putative desulfidase n=1 Tax=Enterococcus xiangfangensis TaxID=1296537 RepID=UPI0035DFC12B